MITPAMTFFRKVMAHKNTVAFPLSASATEDTVTIQTNINTLVVKFASRIVEVWDHRDHLQAMIEFDELDLQEDRLYVGDSNTFIYLT